MWWLLAGCVHVGHSSECLSYSADIADDEAVEGVPATAEDGLALASGPWAGSAAWEDGGDPVAVSGEVLRGGGSAVGTFSTLIDQESRRGFGLFQVDSYTLANVVCEPGLEVPVDVSFATADGALAFTLDGALRALPPFDAGVPPAWEVQGDVDPTDVTADERGVADDLTLALQWFEGAAALPHVSLWSHRAGGEYVQVLESAP